MRSLVTFVIRYRSSLAVFGVVVAVAAAASSLRARPGEVSSLTEYIWAICSAHNRAYSSEEAPFLSDNFDAMTKMMIDMSIRPSGDVDSDFVAMMAPHHQGAIEMARAELRYGRNEQLRRMAQEIIVTQQQEIVAMRFAVGQTPAPSVPAADHVSSAGHVDTKFKTATSGVQEP
jgi:hypothetical protein